MSRGIFITFEGGEGSGKSTQIKLLKEFFEQRQMSVAEFREPGSTTISENIRNILLHHDGDISPQTELFLYCAARAQLIKEKLKPALEQYDVVLCDRYSDSTMVYQGYALGLGIDNISSIVDYGRCGIVPDITFFLDISPEIGLSRLPEAKDRIEQRALEFHQKLRDGYKLLARNEPQRFKIIENDSIEQTMKSIKVYAEELLLKSGVRK